MVSVETNEPHHKKGHEKLSQKFFFLLLHFNFRALGPLEGCATTNSFSKEKVKCSFYQLRINWNDLFYAQCNTECMFAFQEQ